MVEVAVVAVQKYSNFFFFLTVFHGYRIILVLSDNSRMLRPDIGILSYGKMPRHTRIKIIELYRVELLRERSDAFLYFKYRLSTFPVERERKWRRRR